MNDVQEMIVEFCMAWPNAEWGPAHIILSDYNLEDHWFDGVMTGLEFAMQAVESGEEHTHSIDELFATLEFIRELHKIPEDERCFYGDSRD